jgi:hypothetical protein
LDNFEGALKRLVKEWLECGETPFGIARHLLLAAAALLSIHEKLAAHTPEEASE